MAKFKGAKFHQLSSRKLQNSPAAGSSASLSLRFTENASSKLVGTSIKFEFNYLPQQSHGCVPDSS